MIILRVKIKVCYQDVLTAMSCSAILLASTVGSNTNGVSWDSDDPDVASFGCFFAFSSLFFLGDASAAYSADV